MPAGNFAQLTTSLWGAAGAVCAEPRAATVESRAVASVVVKKRMYIVCPEKKKDMSVGALGPGEDTLPATRRELPAA